MQYLIMWLCTVIMSFVIEFSVSFKMFKMAADSGYKINLDKLSPNMPNSEEVFKITKIELSSFLIPVYNIAYSLNRCMNFNNKMDYFLDALNIQGALTEMSEKEKKKYNENPSMIHAFLLSMEESVKPSEKEYSYINHKDKKISDYKESTIDKKNTEIISKSYVPCKSYTDKMIKSLVSEISKNKTDSSEHLNKYDNQSLTKKAIDNNIVEEKEKIYDSNIIDKETNQNLLIKENKKKLLTLKKEILLHKYTKKPNINNKIYIKK